MLTRILGWLGFEVVYACGWGTYRSRYDAGDFQAGRPIHADMSVAPPWARLTVRRKAAP